MRGILALLAVVLASCAPVQSVTPSPPPTKTSVIRSFLSAKPTLTATIKPTPHPTDPAPPGYAHLNVQLVDSAGAPISFERLGPEVFAYPAEKATCDWIAGGGFPGSDKDSRFADWRHANTRGLSQLIVKNPGTYFVLLPTNQGLIWWKGQASCYLATPVKVDGTTDISFPY